MTRFTSILLLLVALLATLALPGPGAAQLKLQSFERDRLVIETAAGARHQLEIELAASPEQRAQGLMFRRDLAPDAGMLFLYGREWPVSMWMKNTLIPLDMLFIDGGGRVVHIAERTVPQSLESVSAGRPVTAVLELNGGTAARLGLAPGDRLLYGAFGTSP